VENQRTPIWIYLALLADVVLFFHKPLFSAEYVFPWDFRGVQVPPITFLAEQLRAGHFALWNPYVYCGFPVFANIEACYFQPLVALSAWIAAHTSMDALPMLLEWAVVLQVWVAGMLAFHVFRRFGAGMAAAFAGAAIFETGGFFASRAENIGMIMAVVWMPLAWLAVLHLSEKFSRRWLAALAAALGLSIVGGFPQATLAVFLSVVVLAVLLCWQAKAPAPLLAWTACGCVLGILLAAVQFLPTTQLTNHSVAQYRADWLREGGGMLPQSLVSLVLPNHYHQFDMSQFRGPGDVTFLYLYCSLAGLALAIYALRMWRNRTVRLLGLMAVFTIFWMLGEHTPMWRWFYPLLPEKVRIGIHPEHTYCILTMAIAGLAALGLESLKARGAVKWAIAAAIAVDLFLVGSGRPMNVISVKQDPGVTRNSFGGSAELLNGVRQRVLAEKPAARIDNTGDTDAFWAIAGPLTGVPSANGISPMAPDKIIALRLYLHDGARWGWYYPLEHLDSPVLDLMGTRYVVTSVKSAPRFAALPKFRHVASLPGNELFENLTVIPRFFVVHEVRQGGSLAGVDFRRIALTEEPIPVAPASGDGADAVRVVRYEPDAVELDVQARGSGLLVASETEYPGWRAWVDGREAAIHRVDVALRGVVVPDGAHRVRMEFRPGILWAGLGVTLATGALLIALAAWGEHGRVG
jgi:Bacterial membrane protein YfhO